VSGRRGIYQNQCAGLYYPFLPADEFFDDHHFPWFATLAKATEAIRNELLALIADPGEALRPYVRLDPGSPQNKWSGLDHSLDWGACFLWEYGQPNQPVLDRCPATAAALAAVPQAVIPGRTPSAFFSMLRPRTRIPAHTGVSNTRAIIHLPLIVPPGCGFRVGGERRSWVPGQPFAFDDTIEHEAWNDSDELRAVLIFDVWNPHLTPGEQDAIARYYAAADASGLNPERPAT
jgi:aspartate beta-hydroxylase